MAKMETMEAGGDDDEAIRAECWCCDKRPSDDGADNLCSECRAERDTHPVWRAIRRVEREEATVERWGNPDPGAWGNYQVRTSDGWIFEIFPDGTPFEDWDYIDRAIAPDGVVWETYSHGQSEPHPPHPMPVSVWGFTPSDRNRWALNPEKTFWEVASAAFAAVAAMVKDRSK